MKRDIQFRGLRTDEGGWVSGYLVVDPQNNHKIYLKPFEGAQAHTYFFVVPSSVGEYTGMNDKNGNPIYGGDMLTPNHGEVKSVVKWSSSYLRFVVENYSYDVDHDEISLCDVIDLSDLMGAHHEVVGNIHEKNK